MLTKFHENRLRIDREIGENLRYSVISTKTTAVNLKSDVTFDHYCTFFLQRATRLTTKH